MPKVKVYVGKSGVQPKATKCKVWNNKTGRWVYRKTQRLPTPTPREEENFSETVLTNTSCSSSTTGTGSGSGTCENLSESQSQITDDHDTPTTSYRSYTEKKRDRLEKWEKLVTDLLTVQTEAQAPSQECCAICDEENHIPNIIRCLDCGSQAYFCIQHYMEYHRVSPFHRPEIWQGEAFLPYQPAEPPELSRKGHHCKTRKCKAVTAVNSKGLSCPVNVAFCGCESEPMTLLRHNLWPATPQHPTTAFHVDLMEWLRTLILECQVSVKGFVDAIAAKMDTLRQLKSNQVTQLYRALITDASNQYMHHQNQLAHLQHIDPKLDDGTSCPACFETERPIISFDGNFGLVRKASSGRSFVITHYDDKYFIKQDEVDKFVSDADTKSKKGGGDCSNFQAGNTLRSKPKVAKLDETGVFGSACRHEFPKKFMNLKHGERLSYPVHLLNTLKAENPEKKLVIMYDIACTLFGHLKNTNQASDAITLVLPIFHCFGHKMTCQLQFGPRRAEGIGLTDGETLERLWSYLRKFSTITKQMTSERRVDLLSEALLHYAQKLRKGLACYLLQKQKKASSTLQSSEKTLQQRHPGITDSALHQLRQAEEKSSQQNASDIGNAEFLKRTAKQFKELSPSEKKDFQKKAHQKNLIITPADKFKWLDRWTKQMANTVDILSEFGGHCSFQTVLNGEYRCIETGKLKLLHDSIGYIARVQKIADEEKSDIPDPLQLDAPVQQQLNATDKDSKKMLRNQVQAILNKAYSDAMGFPVVKPVPYSKLSHLKVTGWPTGIPSLRNPGRLGATAMKEIISKKESISIKLLDSSQLEAQLIEESAELNEPAEQNKTMGKFVSSPPRAEPRESEPAELIEPAEQDVTKEVIEHQRFVSSPPRAEPRESEPAELIEPAEQDVTKEVIEHQSEVQMEISQESEVQMEISQEHGDAILDFVLSAGNHLDAGPIQPVVEKSQDQEQNSGCHGPHRRAHFSPSSKGTSKKSKNQMDTRRDICVY